MNTGSGSSMHNHSPPSQWKVSPIVLMDISNAVSHSISATPKELQKGVGMQYRSMETSLPTANKERIRVIVKRARRDRQ